jgi:hypothetical protein
MKRKDRPRVGGEIDDVLVSKIIRHRQPWLCRRETGERRSIPLHRRPATVPAGADSRNILLKGIAHLIGRNRKLPHADFVAVIKRRSSPQRQ